MHSSTMLITAQVVLTTTNPKSSGSDNVNILFSAVSKSVYMKDNSKLTDH